MCYLIKQNPVAESSDSSSQELLISNTARSRRLGDVGKSKFRCLGAEGLMLSWSQRAPAAQGEKGVRRRWRRGWLRGGRGPEIGLLLLGAGKLPRPGSGACPCPAASPLSRRHCHRDCRFSSLVPLACLEPALIAGIRRKTVP